MGSLKYITRHEEEFFPDLSIYKSLGYSSFYAMER